MPAERRLRRRNGPANAMVPSRAKPKTICFNARLPAKAGRGMPGEPAGQSSPPGLSRAFAAGTPVELI